MGLLLEWWARYRVRARHARDHGTSAVEYGLLVAAVAAVVVGVAFGLGNLIKGQFETVSSSISTCSPNPSNCPAGQVPTK